ncbi:MAG: NADH-quinone oxidoreductase subunit J [Acidobacteriota bacterium]
MPMVEERAVQLVFYTFAAVVIASGALVVYGRNLVYSAFALMATFFGVAVFYVLLGADFLAGAQVLIYVGGILILLLFGVMLTSRIYDLNLRTQTFQVGAGAAVAVLVFVSLVSIIYRTPWRKLPMLEAEPTTEAIGRLFMTDYILPFEAASVLLLVALIGAAMLVRRRY